MVYQRHKNCQIGITICPGLRRTGQNFFPFTIGVVGDTFLEVIAQIYSKGDNCSICGHVSFFVREGFKKKNCEKAVRLTAWVDPPLPSPEAVRKM